MAKYDIIRVVFYSIVLILILISFFINIFTRYGLISYQVGWKYLVNVFRSEKHIKKDFKMIYLSQKEIEEVNGGIIGFFFIMGVRAYNTSRTIVNFF